jgi:23S rRNA A2030 N6-methylase RlmJ
MFCLYLDNRRHGLLGGGQEKTASLRVLFQGTSKYHSVFIRFRDHFHLTELHSSEMAPLRKELPYHTLSHQ